MLRPKPSRIALMRELEANLVERIDEARERVWLGEVAGLERTLEELRAKATQVEHLVESGITDDPVPLT